MIEIAVDVVRDSNRNQELRMKSELGKKIEFSKRSKLFNFRETRPNWENGAHFSRFPSLLRPQRFDVAHSRQKHPKALGRSNRSRERSGREAV